MKGHDVSEIRKMFDDLKRTEELSYHYQLTADYPNGQKDHIKGVVYINSGGHLLYNESDAFLMVYSNHWIYRADHRKKTVTVINLNNKSYKKLKSGLEKDVFENAALTNFVDSVLFKNATVKSYGLKNDTLKAELAFTGKSIKSLAIEYDVQNKLLVSYRMGMFQATERTNEHISGITQQVVCDDFSRAPDDGKYNLDKLFSFDNKNVTLKKYGNYKLYAKP